MLLKHCTIQFAFWKKWSECWFQIKKMIRMLIPNKKMIRMLISDKKKIRMLIPNKKMIRMLIPDKKWSECWFQIKKWSDCWFQISFWKSHQVSWNLDELLKSYNTKYIIRGGGRFAPSSRPVRFKWVCFIEQLVVITIRPLKGC